MLEPSRIQEIARKNLEQIRKVRRHLHANPELSFKEFETSKYLAHQLQALGIEFKDGVAGTGLLGHIQGKGDKVIALRGDMDALPINEANDIEYKSRNPGVMHACGHDVHSSCLLGAAMILHELREELPGSVKLLFQPGEEKLPGGASMMIKEGALKNPDAISILGQHVYPELPQGKVGFRSGAYMASTDEIYVTLTGKGGHGALPYRNIDPILISSHLIVALQQIVSRRAVPTVPCVLSFGKIIGLGATNIIPDEVKLEGTFRTFDEKWRDEAHTLMKDLAYNLVKSMGGTVDFDIRRGYPFLVNHPELTEQMSNAAKNYLGNENVVNLEPRMTAEDFSFFSQEIPACFYRLGTSNPGGGNDAPVHNAHFNVDENALETGSGLMAWLAIQNLIS